MKNYKISDFDEKKLYNKYNELVTDRIEKSKQDDIDEHKKILKNIKYSNLNYLIYELFNLEALDYILISKEYDMLYQSYIEDDILNDINAPAKNYDDIYITGEGTLCSGNCICFTKSCMNQEQQKNFIYKKYDEENDFYSIIINKHKEELYNELINLGFVIIGISGIVDFIPKTYEEQEKSSGEYYINYLIPFKESDKKIFINSSIKYLENQINIKGYTIEKLKSNLIEKLHKLDLEYGTNGKNIYIEFKNNDEFIILLLLLLDGKIQINILESLKKEANVCIINYGINEGIYFNENNGEVFKDGIKLGKINLGTNPFKLFKYLYNNIGEFKTHKEIREEGIGNKRINSEDWQYIAGIKKNLPESIIDLIESEKAGYILRK